MDYESVSVQREQKSKEVLNQRETVLLCGKVAHF